MFGLKLKKNKQGSDADQQSGKSDRAIHLYVSSAGYLIDLGGGQEPISGDVPFDAKDTAVDRIEAAVQAAISSAPSRALRGADRLSLIIDGGVTKFLDARQSNLASATAERRREYGARLVGSGDVSFGMAPLTADDRDNDRPGLFGFIDHQALQRILAATGEHCAKLTQVIPAGSLALARSAGSSMATYGALYFGGTETSVVLINRAQGMALVRHVPVGLRTLVTAVSEKASMSEKDVIAGFAKRNYFQDLENARSKIGSGTTATSVSLGPIEDALLPKMQALVSEVQNTIEFFEEQRGGDRPAQLELMGDFSELRGFRTYLTNALGLPVPRVDSNVFELLLSSNGKDLINLLTGLEGSPITIGKVRYALRDQRLVKAAATPKKSVSNKNRGSSKAAPSASTRTRRRQMPQTDGESLFAKLGFKKKPEGDIAELGGDQKDETLSYMFVFFTLLAGVLYLGWQQVVALDKKVNKQVSFYEQAYAKQNELRESLEKLGLNPVKVRGRKTTEVIDKVLWTEKFLAIGKHMTPALWVTDVYLGSEAKSISEYEVLSSRLVIEGAALPSSDGHISEIANYIERLESDEGRFMSDFRSVSFEGSRVDESESDEVVRFTIAAHYDRNKRLEAKKKRGDGATPGTSSDGESGGLEQMHNAIDQRQKDLDSLTGIPQ